MLPNKDFYQVQEIADHFRVSRSTIYNYIDHGILPNCKKIGGSVRIPKKSIEECLLLAQIEPLK